MKRLISAILAISITASIAKPVKANPAAALPLTLCSTGVGCVLVGTAIIGGVVVYIWKRNDGKLFRANSRGHVLRSDLGESLPDGDAQPVNESDTVLARNADEALRKCKNVAKVWGGTLKPGKPKSIRPGVFLCEFTVWR